MLRYTVKALSSETWLNQPWNMGAVVESILVSSWRTIQSACIKPFSAVNVGYESNHRIKLSLQAFNIVPMLVPNGMHRGQRSPGYSRKLD